MGRLEMLLDTLEGLGVSVRLSETGKIRVQPVSACPAELLEELKENRETLQLFLEQKRHPVSPVSPFPRVTQENYPRHHSRQIPVSPLTPPGPNDLGVSDCVLALRLERGQHPDERLTAAALEGQPGRCVSCSQWQGPDAHGDGLCPLGRAAHGWLDGNPDAPVLTVALHVCAAHNGQGWQAGQSRGPLARPSPGSPLQGLMRASPVVGQVSLGSDSQRATGSTVQR